MNVPSYKSLRGLLLGGVLSRRSSKSSPLDVCVFGLSVPDRLINFPVSGDFHRFSSSFSPIVFISGVVSGILKVFHRDAPLSGILLSISHFGSSRVWCVDQLLVLVNFKVPIGSSRSSSFGIIVYSKINFPDVGALSNLLVCWINVSIKTAAPHLVSIRGYLYTNIIKSLFIISIIPPVIFFSSLRATKTYLNNATVLLV